MKDRTNSLSGRRLTGLLAFMMVFIGTTELVLNIRMPYAFDHYNVLDRVGYTFMIIVGSILLIFRDRFNVMDKLGMAGITLGVAVLLDRSITVWLTFHYKNDYTAFAILYAYLQFVVAILLTYFSILYIRGSTRDGFRMALFLTFSAIMVLYFILFEIINKHISLQDFIDTYLQDAVLMVLYFVFVLAIFTPGAYIRGSTARLRSTIDGFVNHSTTSPDTTILRSKLIEMRDALEDPSSWGMSEDGTPFREYTVRIGSDKESAKMLIFHKSDSSDRIRVMVSNLIVNESVQSTCFDYLCMVPLDGTSLDDCNMVRIFGHDGFYADILLDDCIDYQPDLMDRMEAFDRRKNEIIAEWKKKIWE